MSSGSKRDRTFNGPVRAEVPGSGSQPAKLPTAATWVKVVVLFHVFCITAWACPKPDESVMSGKSQPFGFGWIRYFDQKYVKGDGQLSPPDWTVQCISDPLQTYLFTTGVWQYWDMFAPNPANTDMWGDAVITYKNKQKLVYQYPRMYLLPIPMKYLKERYRKFYERAHDDHQYPWLMPQFGLRVALLNYTDLANPPVDVLLRRHARRVADPGTPQQPGYDSFDYFDYHVDQKLLRDLASRSH